MFASGPPITSIGGVGELPLWRISMDLMNKQR